MLAGSACSAARVSLPDVTRHPTLAFGFGVVPLGLLASDSVARQPGTLVDQARDVGEEGVAAGAKPLGDGVPERPSR